MKVVHIVESLDKGAVENWLVRVFLEGKKHNSNIDWTFYCILEQAGRLDSIVRTAGGRIIYSPVSLSKKFLFLKHLHTTLKNERFDIIHSHHDYLSGFYLISTIGLRFKKRILHIHNTDKSLPLANDFAKRILLTVFRKLAIKLSDLVVGISENVLSVFAGRHWQSSPKNHLLYYGIDLSDFELEFNVADLKQELCLPIYSKLLLFAGRMNEQKNPLFVLDVLQIILQQRDDVYAIFAGEGSLLPQVMEKAKALKIDVNVRLLGWRNDIVKLMRCANVFIFPRIEEPKEGLGLVVIEAQAAGLPMVISNGIVDDAIVIEDLAHFIPLMNNPGEWTSKIIELLNHPSTLSKNDALQIMKASKFEIENASSAFFELYQKRT